MKRPSVIAAGPLHCWRHPRPQGGQGLCVGRTDLAVDARKAKRLAHRIRQHARQTGLGAVVHTSPLRRCRAVADCLQRWGWQVHVDDRLREFDFGHWDGRAWSGIGKAEVDTWVDDFIHHRPGQGEAMTELLQRVASFVGQHRQACVLSHGGWLSALLWLRSGQGAPTAATWPQAPRYGELWSL